MSQPIINHFGTKFWYDEQGQTHREDGPAVEYADGTKCWCQHGRFHREDGPAIECSDGHQEWLQDGKLHRVDGPAVELADGSKEWYLDNKFIDVQTQEEFERMVKLKASW